MIIAIDGPAGSGKSTVAHLLAQRLGFLMLNTGAMYRAVGVTCQAQGLNLTDSEACARVAVQMDLEVDGDGRLLSRGQVVDMDGLIGEAPGAAASQVGLLPEVRKVLVAAQQRVGQRWDLVTEGRDTTTVVFPEADFKFYLTASIEERARRRHGQVGVDQCESSLKADIVSRDRMDSEREASPLSLAEDARVVNTDGMDIEQVVDRLYAWVHPEATADGEVAKSNTTTGGRPLE